MVSVKYDEVDYYLDDLFILRKKDKYGLVNRYNEIFYNVKFTIEELYQMISWYKY